MALLATAASLPLLGAARPAGGQATAQSPISLSIDMDPETPGIQSTRQVAPGASFAVDVVVEGVPADRPLGAFQFSLVYDDTVILAPEVADEGTALDDNPDANQEALGRQGWDCSVFGAAFPQGDRDTESGPGHGKAFIACLNPEGPFQATGTVVLATVRFNATASAGQSDLSLEEAVVGDDGGTEIGSCNPATAFEARCEPARVTIGQAVPSPTGEGTVAAPEETPAGQEATPVATAALPATSAGESEGPWPWPGVGWILAGLAAAAVVGGAALYLRSRLARGP
jgi:hypothetical protein